MRYLRLSTLLIAFLILSCGPHLSKKEIVRQFVSDHILNVPRPFPGVYSIDERDSIKTSHPVSDISPNLRRELFEPYRIITSYVENGNIYLQRKYNQKDSLLEHIRYAFNDKAQLTDVYNDMYGSRPDQKYTYDQQGFLRFSEVYPYSLSTFYPRKTGYEFEYSPSLDSLRIYSYSTNRKGALERFEPPDLWLIKHSGDTTKFSFSSHNGEIREVICYNEHGRLLSHERINPRMRKKESYRYQRKSVRIARLDLETPDGTKHHDYRYELDARGNWVSRTVSCRDSIVSLTSRNYVYY